MCFENFVIALMVVKNFHLESLAFCIFIKMLHFPKLKCSRKCQRKCNAFFLKNAFPLLWELVWKMLFLWSKMHYNALKMQLKYSTCLHKLYFNGNNILVPPNATYRLSCFFLITQSFLTTPIFLNLLLIFFKNLSNFNLLFIFVVVHFTHISKENIYYYSLFFNRFLILKLYFCLATITYWYVKWS